MSLKVLVFLSRKFAFPEQYVTPKTQSRESRYGRQVFELLLNMALDDPSAAGLDEPLIAKSSSSAKQSVAQSAGADKRRCCHGVRKFFLYDAHRPEIQAFYLNQFGRSVLFISFLFLSLGILELANTQAGCAYNPETEQHDICTNDNTAYGVKPASILALMALVGGVATSAFMPFAGAMVDYTNHRRAFGVCCAITLIGVNFAQIFLFEETWFASKYERST